MAFSDITNQAENMLADASERSFLILPGENRIMLSAPHAAPQLREGSPKSAERETGILAVCLNNIAGCHSIIKTKCMDDDANFDPSSPYRDTLSGYVRRERIELLLDLHQLASHREQMICVGTGRGKNIFGRDDILRHIIRTFEDADITPVTVDEPFAAGYQHTVSAHIARECSIPCFQIEINSRLLCGQFDEYRLETVARSLENIIKTYERL